MFLAITLAISLLASPPQESASEVLTPSEWLAIGPLDSRGRRPFRPDAVFEKYLLKPGLVPQAGDRLAGSEGEGAWAVTSGKVERGAYSYAAIEREEAGVFLAQLHRATTLFVNGEGVSGDVYRYGFEGYPVALRKGRNDLFVTGARGGFTLELEAVEPGLRFGARDRMVPDLVRGESQAGYVGLLVVNASSEARSGLSYELEGPEYLRLEPSAPVLGPATLPPLGLGRVAAHLFFDAVPEGVTEVPIVVRERSSGAQTEVIVPIREPGERHRRTYLAQDASVQEYVVNPPAGESDGPMRLALSLHGAGVGAWGQAGSYSPKSDFWVVAATNRRKFGFDWQDWGRQDAQRVLEEGLRLSGVDERYVYVTGHSMGGHGTWHMAANDPDRFAACGPSAGWPSFDTYGGRPEGSKRELWHRADAASLTFDVVENLRQVPPYILHGTADNNVPPGQAHQMIEALTRANITFDTHFEGGAGHWWGGRCVDWPALFDHFRAHEIPEDPDRIEFITVDPAVDSKHHWVSVIQLLEYGRPARVTAERKEDSVEITTENVRVLRVFGGGESYVVDGDLVAPDEVAVSHAKITGFQSLLRTEEGWQAGHAMNGEKSPGMGGPFKRLFDRGFLLVVGTEGDDDRDQALLARARHDASVWTYRGNGQAMVVTDEQVMRSIARAAAHLEEGRPEWELLHWGRNLVLYGNRDDNAAWTPLLGDASPIDVENGAVRLGQRRLEGDLAALFVMGVNLDPTRAGWSTLVGAFASTSTRAARLGDTFAPFISGVGYPDYAVVDLDVLRKGDDGVVAAGWFDHAWRLEE